jgi:hypothetical protein
MNDTTTSTTLARSDDHFVGHVGAFVVDPDAGITHVVLARGHEC